MIGEVHYENRAHPKTFLSSAGYPAAFRRPDSKIRAVDFFNALLV